MTKILIHLNISKNKIVKNYQKKFLKKINLLITFTSYFFKFKIWEHIQIYKYFKKLKNRHCFSEQTTEDAMGGETHKMQQWSMLLVW